MPDTPQDGPAAVLEASTDLGGRLLGARYDVDEMLAHGERGAVYTAVDRNYGRTVTLRISAPQAAVPGAEDVRALARRRMGVRHPHLAAVQGEGLTEGGLHYVATEHVAGRNLHHMIGDPRLRWPATHAIGVQVAEALVALHGAWVMHGDVHPGNLVWTSDDELAIKLVDLDVVGHAGSAYLPPGFSGERDTSCDVYALIAAMYELSTGTPPEPTLAGLAAPPELPEWFTSLLRSVLPGGTIPSIRGLLAILRQGGGLGVPALSVRATSEPVPAARVPAMSEPTPAARVHAPSEPVPMFHAPSGPVPMFHAPSVPVPMFHAPSGAVPVVHAPSGPLPRVHAPSEAVPVASARAPSLPMTAAESEQTEDELWFAAVAAFDPLERLETMAAEAAREVETEAAAVVEDGDSVAVDIDDVPVEPSLPRLTDLEPPPPLPDVPPPPSFGGEVVRVTDLEPPPPFGGDSEEEIPAMVTMRAAFVDPHPTPILGVPVQPASLDPAAPGPVSRPPVDPAAESGSAMPVHPPVSTREYEATAEILLNSRRRALILFGGLVAAVVLAVFAWRSLQAPAEVPAPVQTREPAPVVAPPVKAAAKQVDARPVEKQAETKPPVVEQPAAPAPTEPALAEPSEPGETPSNSAREQVTAHEFRQIMLRSNRSPAIIKCYMQHTAGVEQKVEVVVRVSTRGRVSKLKVDSGPLGDCIRGIVEKLEFPDAQKSAQHQFVYRSPV